MPKIRQSKNEWLTFHLSDAAQRVLEGVQGGGLITVPLLSGEVMLQLFQNLDHLLLGLGFGRLFTAVRGTATSQRLHHSIFLEDARLTRRPAPRCHLGAELSARECKNATAVQSGANSELKTSFVVAVFSFIDPEQRPRGSARFSTGSRGRRSSRRGQNPTLSFVMSGFGCVKGALLVPERVRQMAGGARECGRAGLLMSEL